GASRPSKAGEYPGLALRPGFPDLMGGSGDSAWPASTAAGHQWEHHQERSMKILVVDIGGTNVKMLASGKDTPRKFPSGPELTPQQMVDGVLDATKDWDYEAISIGFPGPVLCGQPMTEPVNLGRGWMGFDFEAAFRRPVRVMNDA